MKKLGIRRGAQLHYYRDVLDHIEPGVLPLVKALDTELTTPIYSCEGHRDKRKEPYIVFVVLPNRKRLFNRFISSQLETTPLEYSYMQFFYRQRPARHGNGPFIDWRITLDVAGGQWESAKAFAEFQQAEIPKYAAFFKTRFAQWGQKQPKHRKRK